MYMLWPTSALEFWMLSELFCKLSELVAGDHQDKRTLVFRGGRADYFGNSINMAARYMDAGAHGGQLVCDLQLATTIAQAWSSAMTDWQDPHIGLPPEQIPGLEGQLMEDGRESGSFSSKRGSITSKRSVPRSFRSAVSAVLTPSGQGRSGRSIFDGSRSRPLSNLLSSRDSRDGNIPRPPATKQDSHGGSYKHQHSLHSVSASGPSAVGMGPNAMSPNDSSSHVNDAWSVGDAQPMDPNTSEDNHPSTSNLASFLSGTLSRKKTLDTVNLSPGQIPAAGRSRGSLAGRGSAAGPSSLHCYTGSEPLTARSSLAPLPPGLSPEGTTPSRQASPSRLGRHADQQQSVHSSSSSVSSLSSQCNNPARVKRNSPSRLSNIYRDEAQSSGRSILSRLSTSQSSSIRKLFGSGSWSRPRPASSTPTQGSILLNTSPLQAWSMAPPAASSLRVSSQRQMSPYTRMSADQQSVTRQAGNMSAAGPRQEPGGGGRRSLGMPSFVDAASASNVEPGLRNRKSLLSSSTTEVALKPNEGQGGVSSHQAATQATLWPVIEQVTGPGPVGEGLAECYDAEESPRENASSGSGYQNAGGVGSLQHGAAQSSMWPVIEHVSGPGPVGEGFVEYDDAEISPQEITPAGSWHQSAGGVGSSHQGAAQSSMWPVIDQVSGPGPAGEGFVESLDAEISPQEITPAGSWHQSAGGVGSSQHGAAQRSMWPVIEQVSGPGPVVEGFVESLDAEISPLENMPGGSFSAGAGPGRLPALAVAAEVAGPVYVGGPVGLAQRPPTGRQNSSRARASTPSHTRSLDAAAAAAFSPASTRASTSSDDIRGGSAHSGPQGDRKAAAAAAYSPASTRASTSSDDIRGGSAHSGPQGDRKAAAAAAFTPASTRASTSSDGIRGGSAHSGPRGDQKSAATFITPSVLPTTLRPSASNGNLIPLNEHSLSLSRLSDSVTSGSTLTSPSRQAPRAFQIGSSPLRQVSTPNTAQTPSRQPGTKSAAVQQSPVGRSVRELQPLQFNQLRVCVLLDNSDRNSSQPDSTPVLEADQTALTGLTGVSMMHLGTFRFKGAEAPVQLVHIAQDSLLARRFPIDPPKGKGNRINAQQGLYLRAPVDLGHVIKMYKMRFKEMQPFLAEG
eukprot:gene10519-7487_t